MRFSCYRTGFKSFSASRKIAVLPYDYLSPGGERGIRTLGTVAGSLVFETSQFNHSCTSPRPSVRRYLVLPIRQKLRPTTTVVLPKLQTVAFAPSVCNFVGRSRYCNPPLLITKTAVRIWRMLTPRDQVCGGSSWRPKQSQELPRV